MKNKNICLILTAMISLSKETKNIVSSNYWFYWSWFYCGQIALLKKVLLILTLSMENWFLI